MADRKTCENCGELYMFHRLRTDMSCKYPKAGTKTFYRESGKRCDGPHRKGAA